MNCVLDDSLVRKGALLRGGGRVQANPNPKAVYATMSEVRMDFGRSVVSMRLGMDTAMAASAC
jgi:hypothetical protein